MTDREGTALHAEEHALIDDLLLVEALDRARDAEDELAADWARHTARSRHATPRRDTPVRTVLRPAR